MPADNKNVQLSTLFSNLEELIVLAKLAADTSAESVIDVNAKINALKAMLDSTVYGMQKMSSNLDDIMVKLDV